MLVFELTSYYSIAILVLQLNLLSLTLTQFSSSSPLRTRLHDGATALDPVIVWVIDHLCIKAMMDTKSKITLFWNHNFQSLWHDCYGNGGFSTLFAVDPDILDGI